MSYAKYLALNCKMDMSFRDELKKLRPKRYIPAKKTSITEVQLNQLLEAIESNDKYKSYKDKLTDKVLILTLVHTGLRASELCNLELEDVDLHSKIIHVKLGKGNKNRSVGINNDLYDVLLKYLECRDFACTYSNFFINKLGKPFNAHALTQKVKRLTNKAGLKDISPHSLRRSFVTINAARGKPLNHLRIACGHSDITTTQGYCMTSQNEVIEAMKEW